MCIDQILMPYWESLTLLLKWHYVKITVWQTRCCWEHHVGYIRLTLTAVSLSSFTGSSLSHSCMWRSRAVWKWLLRNSREPPALLLSPFISSSHLVPWADTKDLSGEGLFHTFPNSIIHVLGSPTLKMSPPLKPHAFLRQTSVSPYF